MSCRKAQEVLDANNLQVEGRTDARKEKLDLAATWDLIQGASRIHVAKGKKVETLDPHKESQEIILKAVTGRTGNLRAPTVRIENEFFVGFNSDLYTEICET